MRAERQYVRVYHDDLQRDYRDIWDDDAALAAWLRLLVLADKMWPSIPELPRAAKPRAIYALTEAKLLERLPSHGFRIRGHDEERKKRQQSASNAAALRWQNTDRTAAGDAEAMPRPRPSRDRAEIPSPAERGKRSNGTNPRAQGTNPRAQGTSPRQIREAEKRAPFPTSVHEILRRAAGGSPE